jgi:hypothetical protein
MLGRLYGPAHAATTANDAPTWMLPSSGVRQRLPSQRAQQGSASPALRRQRGRSEQAECTPAAGPAAAAAVVRRRCAWRLRCRTQHSTAAPAGAPRPSASLSCPRSCPPGAGADLESTWRGLLQDRGSEKGSFRQGQWMRMRQTCGDAMDCRRFSLCERLLAHLHRVQLHAMVYTT